MMVEHSTISSKLIRLFICSALRQRMLDAMTVRGLAERTKDCYVEVVARLALLPPKP